MDGRSGPTMMKPWLGWLMEPLADERNTPLLLVVAKASWHVNSAVWRSAKYTRVASRGQAAFASSCAPYQA